MNFGNFQGTSKRQHDAELVNLERCRDCGWIGIRKTPKQNCPACRPTMGGPDFTVIAKVHAP